jgi:hypothetical protein
LFEVRSATARDASQKSLKHPMSVLNRPEVKGGIALVPETEQGSIFLPWIKTLKFWSRNKIP